MADAVVLKEFLIALGVKIDESGQRRFTDSIQSMTSAVVRLGEGFAGVVAGFVAGVAKMADSSEDLKYLSIRIGDSVSNIDAMAFALSKLGVSPQEAIGNLTKLGDTMRNNPGLRSLWEAYAGTGSPTQQINRFSEFLRGISNPEQLRILHEQFSGVFSEDFWQAMLRPGIQAGQEQFNLTNRIFGFDSNRFAEQSVKFKNALRDVSLDLNTIWSSVSQTFIDRMTESAQTFRTWLEQHAADIRRITTDIGNQLNETAKGALDFVRDVASWFDKLSTSGKEVAEVIGLIGLAFLRPSWARIAAVAYVLEKLLTDYEKFKQTGTSDLGIPWEKIGTGIDYVVTKLGEANAATGGWFNALDLIGAYVAGSLLLRFLRFFGAVRVAAAATATAIDASIGATLVGLTRLLPIALPLLLKGDTGPKADDLPTQEERDKAKSIQSRWRQLLGGKAEEEPATPSRPAVPHSDATPPRVPPTGPVFGQQQQPTGGPGIWERLLNVLSYLNPISTAKAEELPDNIKTLNSKVVDLNTTIQDLLDQMIVNMVFGTGSGGGGSFPGAGAGRKFDINNQQAIDDVKYLMSKGKSWMDAIALVSTAFGESGLNAEAVNPQGGATGLFQHLGTRKTELARYLHSRNTDLKDRHAQYDFALQELETTEQAAGDDLKKRTDLHDKVRSLITNFERPGAGAAFTIPSSLNAANALLSRDPSTYNENKSMRIEDHSQVTVSGMDQPREVSRALEDLQNHKWQRLTGNMSTKLQ